MQSLQKPDNKKVRQSNVLIEATYAQEFTVTELKIFEVVLSYCKAEDIELFNNKLDKEISFTRADLSKILNVSPSVISQESHRISSSLMKKYIEIKNILDDGSIEFQQIGIMPFCQYSNGMLTIHWNYRLLPFLIEINSNFTEYQLHYLLSLRSSYGIKLYKLLYQYRNIGSRVFTVSELKEQFGISSKYNKYNDFKKDIIEPSIKQINELTDLSVKYDEIKLGRRINKIEFIFRLKKVTKQLTQQLDHNISSNNIQTSKIIKAEIIEEFMIIDRLLGVKAHDITDKTKIWLNNIILTKGHDFVECSINYAKKNAKTNFEKYLLDTINNNWVEIETQKLESKRQAEEIEKQQKQAELDLANKQLELENTNKSEIEHLFLKLADSEQIKYSSLANNILNKHAAKLKHATIESLSLSIFAVSNRRYYDKKTEIFISKFLNHSLNINDYKVND